MEQLQQAVAAAFQKVVDSGAVEAAIEKNIAETIQGLVRDQLRPYSPFAKALNEQVAKALQVDLSRLDLPSYGQLILNIVRRRVEAETDNQLAKVVEKQLSELLATAPAEISLQQLVEQFIEEHADDEAERNERITLIVDGRDYGMRWIYMDKAERKDKYSCAIRFLHNHETGKISALRLDGAEVEKTLFIGPLYRFERALFQMHAAGTRLTGVEEHIETNYPGRD
jgi:hypothetical protein